MIEEKIIAACGNDCAACPRYTAYPYEKTDEELHHTAELWKKIGYRDHIVTNEEISCTGCKPESHCVFVQLLKRFYKCSKTLADIRFVGAEDTVKTFPAVIGNPRKLSAVVV